MAESTGPNRAWMSVEYGGYSHGKLMKFFIGGDTGEQVLEEFAHLFGQEAANDAMGKFLAIACEDTTKNAIGNLQSGGVVSSTDPRCDHGIKVKKSGGSGSKAWQAWMCPAKREDPTRCEPEWIK